MNWLKLTDPNGIQPVFVNINEVEEMRRPFGALSTALHFQGITRSVMESPEQILAMLGTKALECGTTSSAADSSAAATDSQCGPTQSWKKTMLFTFVPTAETPGEGLQQLRATGGIPGILYVGDAENTPGSTRLVAAL